MSTPEDTTPAVQPPVLRVISGNPTPEEIAAVAAVLAAAPVGGSGDQAPAASGSLWSRTARVPGGRLAPGPGAWRASALPH